MSFFFFFILLLLPSPEQAVVTGAFLSPPPPGACLRFYGAERSAFPLVIGFNRIDEATCSTSGYSACFCV